MIELSRHIENLLLHHDCVIIPGLGGFITQYVPARYIKDEHILLPPYRSVGFNQQLTLNDGLLVQSYMQAYDTNYPETIRLINEAVHQLKETLQENGEYTLAGIGCLSLGIGGQYNFTPCEAGVISPDLYGLNSLTLRTAQVAESKEQKQANKTSNKVQIKRSDKNYTISISREIVNYAASIAVAIFFYFLWATPVTPSNPQDIQAASIIHNQLFTSEASALPQLAHLNQTQPIALDTIEATQATELHEITTQMKSSETEIGKRSKVETLDKVEGPYTLVLISAITKASAEEHAKQLNQSGFPEIYAYTRGNMSRVVYGNYQTEDEAREAVKNLHKHEQFADAWILKK